MGIGGNPFPHSVAVTDILRYGIEEKSDEGVHYGKYKKGT